MTEIKVSALSSLTDPENADYVLAVDVSASQSKKLLLSAVSTLLASGKQDSSAVLTALATSALPDKGDIIYSDADDGYARLPIINGRYLYANALGVPEWKALGDIVTHNNAEYAAASHTHSYQAANDKLTSLVGVATTGFLYYNDTTEEFSIQANPYTLPQADSSTMGGLTYNSTYLANDVDDKTIVLTSQAYANNGVKCSTTFGTDNRLIRSDGTSLNTQSTGITVTDDDDVSGVNSLKVDTYTAKAVASTATAAGTTNLTTASAPYQIFTGSTTQTVTLPAANCVGSGYTLSYTIKNRSSGNVTVQRAGSDTIDGGTSITLATDEYATLFSDGATAWVRA